MNNSSQSLSQKFLSKGFWLYLFAFLTGPISYIVRIILSGDLSVSEIGILYGVISFVGILSSYNDFWITESLNYFLPKYLLAKDWIKCKSLLVYALCVQLVTSTVLCSILYFGIPFLSQHYFQDARAASALSAFVFFFLISNLFFLLNTVFAASQNTKYQRGTEFFRSVCLLLYCLYLHFSTQNTLAHYSWGWVVALVAGVILSVGLFYKHYYIPYLRNVPFVWDSALSKEVFRYGLWVVLASNIGVILGQIDMQLLLLLKGSSEAGYYSNYLSIINIPFLFLTPIFGLLFPVISELKSAGDSEKIALVKHFFHKYFSAASLFVGMMLFVFGPTLATVLFGSNFVHSGEILRWSCLFLIFNFGLQINFAILGGTGLVKRRARILAIGLPINALLNIVLIHYFAGAGSSLAVGLSWIPMFFLSQKETEAYATPFDWSFLLKNTLLNTLVGVLLIQFALPYTLLFSRVQNFFFMLLIWFFSVLLLAICNYKDLGYIYDEIQVLLKSRAWKK